MKLFVVIIDLSRLSSVFHLGASYLVYIFFSQRNP